MSLAQFGEELKKHRLEKHISLMDISVETRINVRFLEAIEQGEFHILPQTYLRAFVREYAAFVGLNPDDVMKQYDEARLETAPTLSPSAAGTPQVRPQAPAVSLAQRLSMRQKSLGLIVILVVAVSVIILLSSSNRESPGRQSVPEISFDRVVHETEAAIAPKETVATDTVPRHVQADDSLRLEMSTVDSVWISVLIDGKTTESYLLGPNRKRSWAAKDKFVLTMGNAGGAVFRLNGKEVGILGKRGAVLRNATLSRETLSAP